MEGAESREYNIERIELPVLILALDTTTRAGSVALLDGERVLLETRGGRWLVHYEGYGSDWDEVVGPDRIRERRAELQLEDGDEPDDEPDP